MDSVQYYGSHYDGELRTVFRKPDPKFGFAAFRDGDACWCDGWVFYIRTTKGDGPDLISREEAETFLARQTGVERFAEQEPKPPLDVRHAYMGAVVEAWAGVPIPPGIEQIKSFNRDPDASG